MWPALIAYFVLVGVRVWLNNRSLRHYLKLPLVERPAEATELPGVSVVASSPTSFEYPSYEMVGDAKQAQHAWLLFLHPQSRLKPDALSKVMQFALQNRAPAVSIYLQQECATFGERVLLPFAFQQRFISTRTAPSGHVLLTQQDGQAPLVARGERLGSVRQYQDFGELSAGVRAMARGPWTWLGLALSTLAVPCAVYGLASGSAMFEMAALITYVTAVAELSLWEFLFGVPLGYALFQPLAAVVALALAVFQRRG